MDQSTLRLPDPSPHLPHGERRRGVRQKVHTPVYASFNGSQTGMVVDLSELLDLHENGFAVQTAIQGKERLEANRSVSLCLDLPETRSFVHGSGEVMWSDDTGRAGIRFSFLPDPSRRTLKEWLFVNLLVASANHMARAEQLAHCQQGASPAGDDEPSPTDGATPGDGDSRPSHSEPSGLLVAPAAPPAPPGNDALLSALEDVRREAHAIADDPDSLFHLIACYAMALTGATGAALAFLTDDRMICRARAGDPAPSLGSTVDVKQGLSGECVRSGLSVLCEDTSIDLRVDPELCRILDIGSLMAVPIVADFRVVGLLEVFSPYSRGFTPAHAAILDRLVELVPKAEHRKIEAKVENGRTEGTETEGARTEETDIEAKTETETKAEIPVPQPKDVPPEAPQAEATPPVMEKLETTEPAPLPQAEGITAVTEPGTPENDFSIDRLREALWEHAPESESQTQLQSPMPEVEEPNSPDLPEHAFEPLPSSQRRSRLAQLGLLGSAILVISLVLGYLLAPTIEKHWYNAGPSSDSAPRTASASTSASRVESGTVFPASSQVAEGHRLQDLSPLELRNLAGQGDPEAQWRLGVLYHAGEGVPQSDSHAVEWFLRAADQGYVPAQARLGAYYWAGRGVPRDLSKAYFWSELALAQGDEESKSRLEGLATQMTQIEVSNARQQAEAWLHSHTQVAKSASN